MKKFNIFYFESAYFDAHSQKAIFSYSFDKIEKFEEVIDFSSDNFIQKESNPEIIQILLFHIHLALGMSYYKLYPTKTLVSEVFFLDEEAKIFWKKFYKNGLGEFLFTNNLNFKKLFNFENNSKLNNELNIKNKKYTSKKNTYLVPLGGGKDSLVTMSLLEKAGVKYDNYVFGKLDPIKQSCAQLAETNILLTKRQLSENLFLLNKQGYYNGHVAITGMIAFISLLSAYLYGYNNIVLSNEYSANFGNTDFDGLEINHQYSKSYEFETDFKKYIEKYTLIEIHYFSLLRGMYETKIAKLFSKNCKKYFDIFSSCNTNFTLLKNTDIRWCNDCPKCAFVFVLLYAYLDLDEILSIFGKNMFEEPKNIKVFEELLGISGHKPLECVGESQEVIYAFLLIYKKKKNLEKEIVLKHCKKILKPYNTQENIKIIQKKLETIGSEDIIPKELKDIVFPNVTK